MAFKKHYSDVRFSGNLVSPDEIDHYQIATYINPNTGTDWVGTAASTASGAANLTFGYNSKIADYPRNVKVTWTTGAGTAVSGTVTVTGLDQFGSQRVESLAAIGTAAATVTGSVCFAQFQTITARQGTITGDVGTVNVGLAILGTTAKLGLPFKIGSTADVSVIAWASNGTQVPINKGTIGAFIDTTYHAIKAAKTLEGTVGVVVWAKPTYNGEYDIQNNSGLKLLT